MLVLHTALQAEFAGSAPSLEEVRDRLPMLGFPIDGLERRGDDAVLDVDITANRGDVMSHRGLARDLAARLGSSLWALPVVTLAEGTPSREIRIEASACLTYATAELRLDSASTPEEVKTFLTALGATAKGLPAVDASNELLHRYGHPTHAFDAEKVKGTVTVRWAQTGETLTTLDGVSRALTLEDLVIADEAGPIALAGVMGGEPTKVTESTTRVLLESAYFDPKIVRLMARRHSLHSDASHRFGRGADPCMPKVARDLLVGRLQAWAGATLEAAWTVGREPLPLEAISLSKAKLDRIAGEPVPLEEAEVLLIRLGCTVVRQADGLTAGPPSWRHDLSISEDLAEEVLRLRGYDRLSSMLPPLDADPEPLQTTVLRAQSLAKRMAHLGFFQTVTYGFISPEADAEFADTPAEGRTLGNPLGWEYSVMRGSLLPSLRTAAELNLRQGAKEVRLFELAPVYGSAPEGPTSRQVLTFVWGGTIEATAPLGMDQARPRPVHIADLIGVARSLGSVETKVKDLGNGLLGLELEVDALPLAEGRIIPDFGQRMRHFSRIPTAERDLSLLVKVDQNFQALQDALEKAASQGCLIAPPRLVEIYRPKSSAIGQQAWLFRFTFRHPERTLTREEVDVWMQSALAAARSQGAELRG